MAQEHEQEQRVWTENDQADFDQGVSDLIDVIEDRLKSGKMTVEQADRFATIIDRRGH